MERSHIDSFQVEIHTTLLLSVDSYAITNFEKVESCFHTSGGKKNAKNIWLFYSFCVLLQTI